jgi:phosphinothricin acetyltransferase
LIVAEADGRVAGYASLSVFRTKPAYAGTAESSVYVDRCCQRRGIGKALMEDLLKLAGDLGYHAVVTGITGGNEASVRLHLELGFTYVGRFREVGRKFGQWQDVDFYQLILG